MDTKQSQASLSDQLQALGRLAIGAGLYDADDYLISIKREIAALTASLAAERERAEDYRLHADELCTERDAAVARAESLDVQLQEVQADYGELDGKLFAKVERADMAEKDLKTNDIVAAMFIVERDRALAKLKLAEEKASDIESDYDDLHEVVETLRADIDEHLPTYVLDDGTDEEANYRERIEFAGDDIRRLEHELRLSHEFAERSITRAKESEDAALASLAAAEAERDRAVAKVREAVRIAGEKLRGKDITEQEVNSVADLIMREEHCIGWMTTDEMEAAQADVQIRDDQIEDLTRKLAAAREDAVKERGEDTKRLDWLLSFAIVEDVGDEQCVPGVRFRIEDMEGELCGPSLEWTPRQFIDAALARIIKGSKNNG